MSRKFAFYFLTFLLLSGFCIAQNTSISGQVYGFNSERVLLLRKASKNLGFEGPLEGVQLTFKIDGKDYNVKTDNSGFYSISVPHTTNGEVLIIKNGFSKVSIKWTDENKTGRGIISALSFILKKNDDSQNELGTLVYDEAGKLKYAFNDHPKKENADVMQSNKILIEKCVEFNSSNKVAPIPVASSPKVIEKQVTAPQPNKDKTDQGKTVSTPVNTDKEKNKYSEKILSLSEKFNHLDDNNVTGLKTELDDLKQELNRMAAAGEDVEFLRKQINEAESKLLLKEELINTQQQSIERANKIILFMVLFSVFLLASVGLIFYTLQQKKKFNKILTLKNNEITKVNQRLLSSIKYASVIQSNLLSSTQELKQLFSQSFIFNKPKDFLSGDFFWCHEKDGCYYVAVSDCTGHGVPGALLSVLGQRFLTEAVEKENIREPHAIIQKLETKFVSAFKDQSSVEYGVELGLVCFNKQSNELVFSSNGINLFLYQNAGINCIKPKYTDSGSANLQPEDQTFKLNKGDCFYLSSDGFADQFGLVDGKSKKYNLTAMAELLKTVSEKDINSAVGTMEKAHDQWKGELSQTDDILVTGIKIG